VPCVVHSPFQTSDTRREFAALLERNLRAQADRAGNMFRFPSRQTRKTEPWRVQFEHSGQALTPNAVLIE
jgi:hypothetical protein